MTRRSTDSVLIVSPHLDDAAFSCGGLIASLISAGQTVTVATVFAGLPEAGSTSPLGRRLAGPLEPEAWISERRREDTRALAGIGAVVRHGGFIDAAFRQDARARPMYGSWQSVFAGTWRVPDQGLIERIQLQLAAWVCEIAPDRIIAPLGCGAHVDHLLVHEAVVTADWGSHSRLCFYEDLPYSAGSGHPPVRRRFNGKQIVPIDLDAKSLLVRQYCVGLATADEPDVTAETIERYAYFVRDANGVPGERYWHYD